MNKRMTTTLAMGAALALPVVAFALPVRTSIVNLVNARTQQQTDAESGQMQEDIRWEAPQDMFFNVSVSDAASEIVTPANSTKALFLDASNPHDITVTSPLTISENGAYRVTGDISYPITIDTDEVTLILDDATLTSSDVPAITVTKNSCVNIVAEGSSTITTTGADVSAILCDDGSDVALSGTGTISITSDHHGIQTKDETLLTIDGLTIDIDATEDGINSNYDVVISSGTITVAAVDDAIHADHIIMLGSETSTPHITVTSSTEGLEAAVITSYADLDISSSDDAMNATDSDNLYPELTPAINILAGNVSISSTGDGLDSNGNINLVSGTLDVVSATAGGEAAIDYDGSYYVSENFVMDASITVSGPDQMRGGGMQPNDMSQRPMGTPPQNSGNATQQPVDISDEMQRIDGSDETRLGPPDQH